MILSNHRRGMILQQIADELNSTRGITVSGGEALLHYYRNILNQQEANSGDTLIDERP